MNEYLKAVRSCLLVACAWLAMSTVTRAQEGPQKADLGKPTCVSPYYFGPNAFPVPDMLDGVIDTLWHVELAGDYFWGARGDRTGDLQLKINIPLFSNRVCISAWAPVVEWYSNTEANIKECHLEGARGDKQLMKGSMTGDIYVSTDIQLCRQKGWRPYWTVRAVLKTASSSGYHLGRYYDGPGYFFDTTVARDFRLSHTGLFRTLRVGLSTGFLCWQTDNGRQNDAFMYDLMLQLRMKEFTLATVLGGYSGWEPVGADGVKPHDCPVSLKTSFSWRRKHWEALAMWQHGFRDYPYDQLRVGCGYYFDIKKKKNNK